MKTVSKWIYTIENFEHTESNTEKDRDNDKDICEIIFSNSKEMDYIILIKFYNLKLQFNYLIKIYII